MQDRQILGNGKSRILRAPADMPATYEEWRTQMMAGAAYVDISPNNETSGENAGISVEGTPLNKASLLTDALAAALGLANAAAATPSDALGAVRPVALGGTGATTAPAAKDNLGRGTILYEGTLAAGKSASVPGIHDYYLYRIKFSGDNTALLAVKLGTQIIRGIGGYATESNMWINTVGFSVSGETVTLGAALQVSISTGTNHTINTSTKTIQQIVGLL